jgi:hypothetical protein
MDVRAGLRGRFTLFVVALFLASATVSHAAPHTAPRTIPVYIFAGQSNMVGASSPAEDLPDLAPDLVGPQRDVSFFGPTDDHATTWAPVQAPTEIAGATYGPGFGPELSAGASLATDEAPIAIVKDAHDGTNLYSNWDPSDPDSLYAGMIARVRTAISQLRRQTHATPRLAAFVWMQGEGDSYSEHHARDYGAHLRDLIAHVRRDLGAPDLRIVLGRIAPIAGPFASVVRAEQADVAQHTAHTALVETQDLAHDPVSAVHLTAAGEIEFGHRIARVLQ